MIANKDWIDRYSNMEVVVLPTRNSDHLLMHLVKMDRVVRKPKPFRFETSWTLTSNGGRIVESI